MNIWPIYSIIDNFNKLPMENSNTSVDDLSASLSFIEFQYQLQWICILVLPKFAYSHFDQRGSYTLQCCSTRAKNCQAQYIENHCHFCLYIVYATYYY